MTLIPGIHSPTNREEPPKPHALSLPAAQDVTLSHFPPRRT
jgi:hypothetical protein